MIDNTTPIYPLVREHMIIVAQHTWSIAHIDSPLRNSLWLMSASSAGSSGVLAVTRSDIVRRLCLYLWGVGTWVVLCTAWGANAAMR